ncbi:MAG: hypothetical protein IKG58_03925 [Bacilli bacterium]|nr:hypothetical protein [Bacilli bacterium]
MTKKEDKKIPVKNYVILGIIFLVSIVLVIYLCNCYKVYDESQRQIPVVRGHLSEITESEIDSYLMENPTTVLYMCTASSFECRNYEKDFIKLIDDKNLVNSIIYINLSDSNMDSFINNFNRNHKYKEKLTNNYPAFVVFEDSKVTNILQGSEKEKLTISKTKSFLDLNKIGK